MTVDPAVLVDQGPRDDHGQPLPAIVAGIVARVPATTADLLQVTVGAFDDDAKAWSFSCRWQTQVDAAGAYVPPIAGGTCVVFFDNQDAPWAIYWPH